MIKYESWRTFFFRWFMNFWPCFRGTGARISYISADWMEVKVKLPLNWRTRNYVGTIFGGSLYAAVDPFYMLMFIKVLGSEYIVWDTEASIDFIKPGRSTLFANFKITKSDIEEVKELLKLQRTVIKEYPVELVDKEGTAHAKVIKSLYFRRKQ